MVESSDTAHRERAFAYFRDRLEQGLTLAESFLRQIDLASGTLGTLIFDDGVGDVIEAFEYGPSPREVGDDVDLSNHIFDYLDTASGHLVVLENGAASPHYPFVASFIGDIRTHDAEVYHVIGAADLDTDRIEKIVRQAADAYLAIGMMTSAPRTGFLPVGRELNEDHLRVLAKRAEHVFVSAYDSEGYLVWSRQ